jgi:16S rRNA (cytidine1402-2'-O)-methyltransferase
VECLGQADIIACEDTRHSRKLLAHYEITPKELVALHDHNERTRSVDLISRIRSSGETLVMISDAGAPSISDPGFRLVNAAIEREVSVEVIPGPSAVITALVGSGLPTDSFSFAGFLPVKSGKKHRMLEAAMNSEGTSVFFESPHRIEKTLEAIATIDAERPVVVARELTKKFETYHRGTPGELLAEMSQGKARGEITLLIQGLSRSDLKKRKPDQPPQG